MDRGEIWLVSLDPIAGHEQSGKRPVLIVSRASFNKLTRLPVVVPITSGGKLCSHGRFHRFTGRGRDKNDWRYSLRPAQNH
ncbi:mRNA interferase PemK [Raoultella terrigena]|uniref:mRNA interferase PemK n=1 Tax=Raoultella terrigena TaxID=577 RepID=A0A4U9CZ30_RAOTE|nr:mRNA interferase PemK [Raoultella terrigena]